MLTEQASKALHEQMTREPVQLRFVVNQTEIHRQPIPAEDITLYPDGLSIRNSEGFVVENDTEEEGLLVAELWVGSECIFKTRVEEDMASGHFVEVRPNTHNLIALRGRLT